MNEIKHTMNASNEKIKKIEIWKQDGKLLATGGRDKTITVFPCNSPKP
jgi:WD40 repeat protein